MEGIQMDLFCGGNEEESISDFDFENSKKVREAYHDATRYGHVSALKCQDYKVLAVMFNAYADGVAIALGLNRDERQDVINYAFASADRLIHTKH